MACLNEKEIREAFDHFDKDRDNCITDAELGDALRLAGMNPTDDEIKKLIETADKDGNGKIEYLEFLKFMKSLEDIDCREELRAAFNHFDINGDGRISAEELQRRLGYSIDDAKEIIKEADQDKDGFINLDEFTAMLTQNAHVFD